MISKQCECVYDIQSYSYILECCLFGVNHHSILVSACVGKNSMPARCMGVMSSGTGWSINNRTILNCSHFLARRYYFNPFSPKRSIHTGKLRQQHEFTNASFIILVRCHFVSPYHVDGSANNVLCRGGHFCEIAGIIAQ